MIQDTVLIRHLPSALTHQEKSELLRHFGAVDVKIVGPESKKTNLAFARFESDRAAEVAVQKLHQLNVFGQKISAEVARGASAGAVDPVESRTLNIDEEKQDRILKARETFLKKLGLSIKNYDFNQPPPLNIFYQYPPPTKIVLENIGKAMANVPKFYNQVLHLMNKMNLPCPFTETYPIDSELFQEKSTNPATVEIANTILDENEIEEISMSEEESEMGSDVENKGTVIIPVKRKRVTKKVIKRPKFVKPQAFVTPNTNSKSSLKPNDVFEDLKIEQVHKKIEMKITADLSSIQEAQEIQASDRTKEGFGLIKAPQKVVEKDVENEEMESNQIEDNSPTCITSEQLASNRISSKDQRVLPVFKKYQPGAPSCRLYIKNLAKHVQTRDLHFIYKRYYRPELDNVQGTMFDVRLMQEGRMKGQAFITLQSVDQAQAALRETNGYILKDKPMVVQFARSAATK